MDAALFGACGACNGKIRRPPSRLPDGDPWRAHATGRKSAPEGTKGGRSTVDVVCATDSISPNKMSHNVSLYQSEPCRPRRGTHRKEGLFRFEEGNLKSIRALPACSVIISGFLFRAILGSLGQRGLTARMANSYRPRKSATLPSGFLVLGMQAPSPQIGSIARPSQSAPFSFTVHGNRACRCITSS